MIDSKELRKGNMVRSVVHLPVGYHISELPHAEITEIKDIYVETDEGPRKYREIDPIPLTEEILLKAGGVKNEDNEIVFTDTDTSTPDVSVLSDSGKFYLGSELHKVDKYSIPIDSVHKFQNLYFDLMGKDIQIKL